jgi:hypothetical protein
LIEAFPSIRRYAMPRDQRAVVRQVAFAQALAFGLGGLQDLPRKGVGLGA